MSLRHPHLLGFVLVGWSLLAGGNHLGSAPPPDAALKLVNGGYKKLGPPSWLSGEKALLFTDLNAGKLYRLDPAGGAVVALRAKTWRGRVGPEGRFHGLVDGKGRARQ